MMIWIWLSVVAGIGSGSMGEAWPGAAAARPEAERNWPAWRGPLATGVAPHADPPIEWSEKKNIRWKVEIPGRGHATPIVWGDRVFVLTAVESSKEPAPPYAESGFADHAVAQPADRPGGRRRGWRRQSSAPLRVHEFRVLALDRRTGRTIWSKTVREEAPHESGHTDASPASNSPVTDGEHVYAYFGSRGLYCLSMEGQVKWDVDFGDMQTRNEFGEGSSPALYGDTIIVNWDHEGDDFVVALDKRTGKQRWKIPRDEPTSWSTPIVVESGGRPQVVVTATNFVRGYDLETGREVWRCRGMTQNTIPSPMAGGGMLYALSGFRGNALLAIRYDGASGDITDTPAVVWKHDRDTPYVPSGLLYNNRLYFLDNNRPILSCLDARTGKPLYTRQRLDGVDGVYASPVGAAGRVYIAGRNGTTLVLTDGDSFQLLASNTLEDGFDASPAAVEEALYLRGRRHLYCVAAQ